MAGQKLRRMVLECTVRPHRLACPSYGGVVARFSLTETETDKKRGGVSKQKQQKQKQWQRLMYTETET